MSMTYEEFKSKVEETIDFSKQIIVFECTKCGDKHFAEAIGKYTFQLRMKCYRCLPEKPEVIFYGRSR